MSKNLEILNIESIKKMASGDIVELPGWNEKPFVCKLKRVSMLGLVQGGKIPNTLLQSAQKVFMDGVGSSEDEIDFKEMSDLLDIFVKGSLVEPDIKTLKDNKIELTDDQKIAIFQYSQSGMAALKKFRTNN